MANQHQSFNPGMNHHRMNHYQQRMPPPTNPMRPHYAQQQQGYPAGHAGPPFIQSTVPIIPSQQFFYQTNNGVRNTTPMQPYIQTPQGGAVYNTFPQTMPPTGSASQPAQQNIYQQQAFIPSGGMYPPGVPQPRYIYTVPPTQGTPIVPQGYPMPGSMPPHSQQPAPNPPGHMPPGPTLPPQQGGKPPFQQVPISASMPPPPSSTPSQPPVPSSLATGGGSAVTSYQQPHQQITVSQPPPQLMKKEKRVLNIINPATGKSIFANGSLSAASTPSGPRPPSVPHAEEAAADGDKSAAHPQQQQQNVPEPGSAPHQDMPEPGSLQQPPPSVLPPAPTTMSAPPPAATSAPPPPVVPSTDVKEATPPPPAAVQSAAPQTVVNEPAPAQDKEMLSVTVETKRDETLYEPVSPTPLPDSPVEEAKGVSTTAAPQQQTGVSQQQHVSSGQAKYDKSQAQQEDDAGFTEAANRNRKKKSVATRKAELNRKGQEKERKGGDLLEVFKPSAEPASSADIPQSISPAVAPSQSSAGGSSSKLQTPEPQQQGVFKEPTPPAPSKEPSPLLSGGSASKKEPTPPIMSGSKMGEQQQQQQLAKSDSHHHRSSSRHHSATPETVKVNGVGDKSGGPATDKMDVDPAAAAAQSVADADEDLEEGEIPESPPKSAQGEDGRKAGSVSGGSEVKLKYNYKEDMWSPLNPHGKKQYDRDFLIQLQHDELSQIKPPRLPDMDIIKDEPIRRDISRSSYNIEPSYIKSSVSQSRGHGGRESGMGKRPSKSKEPVKRINIPSIHQNVELRKAEQAWVPMAVVKKKGIDKEEDEIEELKKKVRSILNKLTPQKFDTLVQQFQELTIETKVKLEASMELVFEKAVDEPAFSKAYAQMCQILSMKDIIDDGGKQVKFKSILIKRVQKEFEKDYMKDVDQSLKIKAENPDLTEEEKKSAKEEYEAQELKARRRSLGNIKFIGELYNLNILTINIMHQCVNKLLDKTDEESLEGLCRLVTTVGLQFDQDTAKIMNQRQSASESFLKKHQSVRNIDEYFDRMNKIITSRSTSSRVRFLMQDVIDLKKAGWKKRREEAGPKKIDQIHEDVKKEKLTAELNNMNTMSYPKQRDSQGPPGGDARRRSQRGPAADPDGWSTITTRPARNTLNNIDTNKLKSMSRNTTDVDSISLMPKSGGFGGWGKGSAGSAGSRVSRQEEINTSNRYASFGSSESSSNTPYEGRTSGGYEGRSSTGYEGRMSSGYGGRMGGGGGRPGSYVGRSSRGRDENERSKAIQAVKEFHPGPGAGGRSVSTIMSSESDRGRTSVPSKSASMRIPSKKREQDPGFQGSADMDEEKLKTISESRVNEFLSTKDYKEVHQGLREKFHPSTVIIFVETTFNNVLEKRPEERKLVGLLFSSLVKEGLVTEEKLIEGLSSILEIGSDLEIDIPKFWETLVSVLVASVTDGNLSLSALAEASRTKEPEVANRAKFMAALLHSLRAESATRVGTLWADSGVNLANFLTGSNGSKKDVDSFLRDNKLDFLHTAAAPASRNTESSGAPSPSSSSSAFDPAAFSSDLRNRLKAGSSPPEVLTFITDRVTNLQNVEVVRTLVTQLAEDSLEGLGGPVNDIRLSEMKFTTYCTDILADLMQRPEEEVQCLFAIQLLAHKLEQPAGLFTKLLEVMYNSDVVSLESCNKWKGDKSVENQEGKGVCVAASQNFFVQLSEEQDEEDEG